MKTALKFLEVGDQFVIPGLKTYRNLTVVRHSDCAMAAQGDERADEDSPWHNNPLIYLAANTEVEKTGHVEVYDAGMGIMKVKSKARESKRNGRKSASLQADAPNGAALQLPTDREFTVKELAAELNLMPYVVHNELKRRGDYVRVVGELKGGRGKPSKIYKILD